MTKLTMVFTQGWIAFCLAASGPMGIAQALPESPYYSRVNTFGIFADYSNDSSHILMGISENRKLLGFGASYGRRLIQNSVVNWQYNAEILPIALESDPLITQVTSVTPSPTPGLSFSSTFAPVAACHNSSGNYSETFGGIVYNYSYVDSCSRRWTMGEAMSPVGFQWNFEPRRKIQPLLIAHGGYMYSTQPIPTEGAGSFNFTFDVGVGVEFYRTRTRSLQAEYRFHHISNHGTSDENPGIDNGVFQVTYAFGR